MRFNLSLTCVCLMTVLLQYTCSAACMPLEKTRTKNQAPTSSSQSSGECALLSTEKLASLRMHIRSKLQSISTQMNEITYDIFRVSATSCECARIGYYGWDPGNTNYNAMYYYPSFLLLQGQLSSSIGLYTNREFSQRDVNRQNVR